MSQSTTDTTKSDSSGQQDESRQTVTSARLSTPGARTSRETPGGQRTTARERPSIHLSFVVELTIVAGCTPLEYRTA